MSESAGSVAAHRSRGSAPSSATVVQTASSTQQPRVNAVPSATLRLRANGQSQSASLQPEEEDERHVQWADDVVNNEGMGKKSSKVCCIYHKPRPVDESSDEDSSDSSSDNDSNDDDDDGTARASKQRNAGSNHKHHPSQQHKHGKDQPCNHDAAGKTSKNSTPKRAVNAYERVPKTS